MHQILRCADTGLRCDFLICGQTTEEVLYSAKEHMKEFHREEFSKDLHEKARNAVREGDCEKEIRAGRILLF
jgi:predicted small metal-binding protein